MTRNRLWGSAVALLVAALAGLAAAAPAAASLAPTAPVASTVAALSAAPAGLDDFTFDSFDGDYTISRADDGTSRLRVVETIVADFPAADQNRGIRRSIPDTYNKQPLRAQLVSITDENGRERESEVEDADGAFSVVSRADDYVHGRQTYVITYTLENVTWNFPDTGLEFYWDVNGVDWAQPFGSVTGRLHVPTELADRLTGTTSCYQGPHGATTRCDAIGSDDEPGGVVVTARASSLMPYQTLTMAVGFAPGTFQMFDASYLASPFGWLQGLVGIGAVGVGVWGLRRRRAVKDAPGRPTLIAEYEPPTTVDALESAVLLGRQSKAIPAEVLEQAVVGSIRIVEGEPGFWGKKPLVAELVDPSRADGDGRLLLQGLFPHGAPGETYTFGRQDTRFSQVAQSIVSAADKELTARGMRRTVPPGTRLWPIAAAVVAVMLAFALAMAAIGRSVHPGIPLAVLGVCGVVVFVVVGSLARRPLSARGAETRDHLLGLESFIAWAEADRIRMLQSPQGAERVPIDVNDPRQKLALYEKLLPYAVVFGQEKEWSKQLSVLYSAVGASGPYWYVGTGSFDASSFATTVGSLSAAASASSSTSGGSSGGGSAGGGGGGGGGGGV
ncbi:MAG: hypothetical protein ABS63_08320 [Microbacterium sp. SCN 70-27]|uniref:DUF2207 family protein n=1 Tax=unclassified Microbacterium TaxID=2609290 RepID=UPI00086D191B|nr:MULTISPECIES: DUF2207 domain-containing protein [unclassified Microbacterium]MBN9223875.1 DUF2207 domain-containing protein [Microbacterium sp.]ODT27467.1 MAG: hypothetical protein ABS63_08320 [Microbacterium sp. SCN 70-27]